MDMPATRRFERVHVYVDVSGSMDAVIPLVYGALLPLMEYLEPRIHLFSTQVEDIRPRDLRAGVVKTTCGTAIHCVAAHILRRKVRRAVLVTDGWVGQVPSQHLKALRRRRVRTNVVLTAGGDPSFAAALGARVFTLPPLPTPPGATGGPAPFPTPSNPTGGVDPMNEKRLESAEHVLPGHPDKLCDALVDAVVDHVRRGREGACAGDPDGQCGLEAAAVFGSLYLTGRVAARLDVLKDLHVERMAADVYRSAGYGEDSARHRWVPEPSGPGGGDPALHRRVRRGGAGGSPPLRRPGRVRGLCPGLPRDRLAAPRPLAGQPDRPGALRPPGPEGRRAGGARREGAGDGGDRRPPLAAREGVRVPQPPREERLALPAPVHRGGRGDGMRRPGHARHHPERRRHVRGRRPQRRQRPVRQEARGGRLRPHRPHRRGAWSGKDFHKVDRLGGLLARSLAKQAVVAAHAREALVTLEYAPGCDRPVRVRGQLDGKEVGSRLLRLLGDPEVANQAVWARYVNCPASLVELARWGHQVEGVGWE
jgi:hypothetical protein